MSELSDIPDNMISDFSSTQNKKISKTLENLWS